MNEEQNTAFESWAIIEIMGHRRLGGFVREVQIAGAGFFRIDIPGDEDKMLSTQFYPPASVYCLTPVSEAAARIVAKRSRPEPVTQWELPAPRGRASEHCSDCGTALEFENDGPLCRRCQREEDHDDD